MSEDCKSDAIGIGRQTDDFCPVRWRNIFHCSLVEASDTRLCILHHANPAESYGSNRGRGSLCEWGISVLIAINILESHHKPGSKLDREGTKKNAKWYVLGVLTKQLGWQKIRRNLKEQRPSTKWVVRWEPTQAFGMEWPPSGVWCGGRQRILFGKPISVAYVWVKCKWEWTSSWEHTVFKYLEVIFRIWVRL